MAETEKGFWRRFEKVLEVVQTAGVASQALEFFQKLSPAANTVLNEFAPGAAMSLKRAKQKGSEGFTDDIHFINTVLALDGQNPKRQQRPLMKRIMEYLVWLNNKDTSLAIIFVWVTGLDMDDDERFKFLYNLALISDDTGERSGEAANQARFEFTQQLEAFRKPEGVISKLLRENPTFRQQWQKLRALHRLDRMKFGDAADDAEDTFNITFEKIKGRFDPATPMPSAKERKGWRYWLKIWA